MNKRLGPALLLLAALPVLPVSSGPARDDSGADTRTGILSAFSEELDRLEEMLTEPSEATILGMRFLTGKLNGRPVVIATTGAGKVNASMVATLLIDRYQPAEVLFTGIAGAIHSELGPGDVVIGERTVQHDLGDLTDSGLELRGMRNPLDWVRNPVYLEADARLLAAAQSAADSLELVKVKVGGKERTPRILRGVIATGDVFVSSASRKAELRKAMNASAVDMEGAAVAQICRQLQVPCLVIRGISDSAEADARKQAGQFLTVAAQNSTRLVAEIARRLARAGEQPRPR